jgi:NAD(P)-dependent dehydrogenase (short-subunit alcohol dehydrogenase family)
MDFGISGRTAVVTGTDDALGAACRRALEREGVRVIDELSADADIVVSHGGAHARTSVLDVSSADELHRAWDGVVDAVAGYRQVLPAMSSRRWGRLVWVGSAAAKSLDADDDELGAIVSLAMMAAHKVVAAEAGPSNVTANAVLSGGTATDDDAAAMVAFLCSEGAGYLTGVTITVDGGVGSAVY